MDEQSGGALVLKGKLIATTPHGEELTDLDGSFRLGIRSQGLSSERRVDYWNGSWETTLQEPAAIDRLYTKGVLFDRGPHPIHPGLVLQVSEPKDMFLVPSSGEITLRVNLSDLALLRVLDAETEQDLNDVVLVTPLKDFDKRFDHPGSDMRSRALHEAQPSPIVLSPYFAQGTLRAKTDENPASKSHPRHFRPPGHPLKEQESHVFGVDPAVQAHLRIREVGELVPIASAELDANGRFEFQGLPAGEYWVSGEVGGRYLYSVKRIDLGSTSVQLKVREPKTISLTLKAAPTVAKAAAGGAIYVAQEWKGLAPDLELYFFGTHMAGQEETQRFEAEEMESDRDGYDAYQWVRPDLLVGRYELELCEPFHIGQAFDLIPAGNTHVEFVVPAPVEALVRCVDRDSGELLKDARVFWSSLTERRYGGFHASSALFKRRKQGHVLRLPAAVVRVRVKMDAYLEYDEAIDFGGGNLGHTIPLERASGVILRVLDGESEISVTDCMLIPEDLTLGDRISHISSRGRLGHTLTCEPGSYTFRLPKLEGYEATQDRTVEIRYGEFMPLTIELQRE